MHLSYLGRLQTTIENANYKLKTFGDKKVDEMIDRKIHYNSLSDLEENLTLLSTKYFRRPE